MIFFTASQYEYDDALNSEIGSLGMTEEDCESYGLDFYNGGLSDFVPHAEDRIGFYHSDELMQFLKAHLLFQPIVQSIDKVDEQNNDFQDGLYSFEFDKEARAKLTAEYLANHLDEQNRWQVEAIIELIDHVMEEDRVFCIVSG